MDEQRRELILKDLDEVVTECNRLLEVGYRRSGNWTLGQMCNHIRETMDANMKGYPTWMTVLGYPLRPFLRRFALPNLLEGNSPSGIRTAARYVPGEDLNDAEEFDKLKECVVRFNDFAGDLNPHPGFGRMSHGEFNAFHAAHAAHHLSFLIPID